MSVSQHCLCEHSPVRFGMSYYLANYFNQFLPAINLFPAAILNLCPPSNPLYTYGRLNEKINIIEKY